MKTRDVFVVTVQDGLFRDTIVSTKLTVAEAINDGLRWYRYAAKSPLTNPNITVERYQLIV